MNNFDGNSRNVFLYWVGKEYKLISILRNLMYLHSTNGKGYNVVLITNENLREYVSEIPSYFNTMCPAHQADFVRINVICEYGGIWLDSDTLVLDSLDTLFDLLEMKNGFFIKEGNTILWNGIFGSRPKTELMINWKTEMIGKLNKKQGKIDWTEIGNELLQKVWNDNSELYANYEIFNGLDNMYPVNWIECLEEYINKPYDNYKNIVRGYQPLVVLVNSVYKELETKNAPILRGNAPLNYFINKSFENMKLIDYDFIEIGTSNFDTLIQNSTDDTIGISVDAVKYYIDALPNKQNVTKLNVAISDRDASIDVFYIPEKVIEQNNLPHWFKGCNSINAFHPLHIAHNVFNLCKIEKVDVITTYKLFYKNRVKKVKYLKIDTEGHDCTILMCLFHYVKNLPKDFYPSKILFESNEHSNPVKVKQIIDLYCSIGYSLQSSGYDTIITFA
jgi:hypothetical protein